MRGVERGDVNVRLNISGPMGVEASFRNVVGMVEVTGNIGGCGGARASGATP